MIPGRISVQVHSNSFFLSSNTHKYYSVGLSGSTAYFQKEVPTMVKLSVSIPDDIYQEILNTIPENTPFSQGLTALIRRGLGLPEDPKIPIVIGRTDSITEVTPEIQKCILEIVRAEILRISHLSNSTINNSLDIENSKETNIQTENKLSIEHYPSAIELATCSQEEIAQEEIINSSNPVIETGDSEWIKQSDIVNMLPETMLLLTRKGKVSKAVASGKMITNGLSKTDCRILRSSAQQWVSEVIS